MQGEFQNFADFGTLPARIHGSCCTRPMLPASYIQRRGEGRIRLVRTAGATLPCRPGKNKERAREILPRRKVRRRRGRPSSAEYAHDLWNSRAFGSGHSRHTSAVGHHRYLHPPLIMCKGMTAVVILPVDNLPGGQAGQKQEPSQVQLGMPWHGKPNYTRMHTTGHVGSPGPWDPLGRVDEARGPRPKFGSRDPNPLIFF